jgi:thymidylate synthase ThyX
MISAKIVADSITAQGHRLTTMEVIFPRYILAELNTHRVLSKNSASSRAIPFSKMVKSVQDNPFIPYAWQKDHKGMQGNEYFTEIENIKSAEGEWLNARNNSIIQANHLNNSIGVTKQLANRLLEPFMYHKVLVSATEWDNFFNLRCPSYVVLDKVYKSKKDILKDFSDTVAYQNYTTLDWLNINTGQADIHMMFLAEVMYDARNESTPRKLKEGEWHIPYGNNMDIEQMATIAPNELTGITMAKISIARCARLSYQTLGDNPVIDYEKDLQLYEILSKSGHWSPFEHVAKVMTEDEYNYNVNGEIDITHREEGYTDLINIPERIKGWCRNFRGFKQYRILLD